MPARSCPHWQPPRRSVQAKVDYLVSQLNFKLRDKPRRLKNKDGPEGRALKIQKPLTALLQYERIELNWNRADEVRGYAEQLISQALRHGPNKYMMDMANFWILDKLYIHKLFSVIIKRFANETTYTNLVRVPRPYPGQPFKRAVLELKGNPFPPLPMKATDGRHLLQNILLSEANKDYRTQQCEKLLQDLKI